MRILLVTAALAASVAAQLPQSERLPVNIGASHYIRLL